MEDGVVDGKEDRSIVDFEEGTGDRAAEGFADARTDEANDGVVLGPLDGRMLGDSEGAEGLLLGLTRGLGVEQTMLLIENEPKKVVASLHVPWLQELIKQTAVTPLDRAGLKDWFTWIGVLTNWLYWEGKLPMLVDPQLQIGPNAPPKL